jgi:hypothetical protein
MSAFRNIKIGMNQNGLESGINENDKSIYIQLVQTVMITLQDN